MKSSAKVPALRVIDANINRLREALRVVEEYYRFVRPDAAAAQQCKKLRHSLARFERVLGRAALLKNRDTKNDPFAGADHKETKQRPSIAALFIANCKRGQEAARVLEEYSKIVPGAAGLAPRAKTIRFALYRLEQKSITEKRI
jgi:thiamine-phosphate pyrophosphorylase